MVIHGRPYARDTWGYNGHQWPRQSRLCRAEREFRGSTGFGKAFVNAADQGGLGACRTI